MRLCKRCGNKIYKNGIRNNKQRYKCSVCKYEFEEKTVSESQVDGSKNLTNTIYDDLKYKVSEDDTFRYERVHIENEPNLKKVTVGKIRTLEEFWIHSKLDSKDWIVRDIWSSDVKYTVHLIPVTPAEQKIPVIQPLKLPVIRQIVTTSRKVRTKKTLVVSDMHVGYSRDFESNTLTAYQDERCISIMMDIAQNEQPDEIILAGDLLDLAEASKYAKKAEFVFTMQPAINRLGTILVQLRQIVPKADIIYIPGNHENRLKKYLADNMMFAYNLKQFNSNNELFSLKHIMDLDAIDVKVLGSYPEGEYYINQHLRVIHGEKIDPKNELNSSDISTIHGHLHRSHTVYKTRRGKHKRKPIMVKSIPCMCRIDGVVPSVSSHENWQQGLTWVETTNEYFTCQDIMICEGETVFKGKEYKY